MKLFNGLTGIIAFALALFAVLGHGAESIDGRTTCYTSMGPSSKEQCPTSWHSTTYSDHCCSPRPTTYKISTSTSTSTFHVLTFVYNTITTTLTKPISVLTQTTPFAFQTFTQEFFTNTATVSSTVFSGTTTCTIPTSASFIPIISSLPKINNRENSSSQSLRRTGSRRGYRAKRGFSGQNLRQNRRRHPQNVDCWVRHSTCNTDVKTVSVTNYDIRLSEIDRTSTKTYTSTVAPLAKSTTTVTDYSFVTSTEKLTHISIIHDLTTQHVATATVIEACQKDNIVSRISGYPFSAYYISSADPQLVEIEVAARNAYECCQAAINGGVPFGPWAFFGLNDPSYDACLLVENHACKSIPAPPSHFTADIQAIPSGEPSFAAGNGYCGQWNYDTVFDADS